MVRLDDDDILAEDSLEYLSNLYHTNQELEFSYGSAILFGEGGLNRLVQTIAPTECQPSRDDWAAYTIPNNHPWDKPWAFYKDFHPYPKQWTSLIHCAKSNIMCIYHTYVMRTESVRRVKDKITVTSNFVDDLEFLGSLDYLGLGSPTPTPFVQSYKVADNKTKTCQPNAFNSEFRQYGVYGDNSNRTYTMN
jgi:hypothetical protein